MDELRKPRLQKFVDWAAQYIKGDEKGEAQIFLEHLFQAFGQLGTKEVGAALEERVKNNRGGTSFADLVWKPKVLIEMKKRGADLSEHLQQAFDYWTRLVPGRPRYVVLCNFDEFRIYDFDVDISDPQDVVALAELPERFKALAFLFPTDERPTFKIDREKVTRESADLLAAAYNSLASRADVSPDTAQRFILQILVALFSEDIGFLPKGFVTELLDDCTTPPKAFDLLGGLFGAMNSRENKGGRFKAVPYFNGGLFAHPAPIELDPDYEVVKLRLASQNNWSHVSPDIFGTLFQHSLGAEERHAFGAHYTSPVDIMKIVKPTIVDPFRDRIAAADTLAGLTDIRQQLTSLRVLDPACGSGNFLYIAYREMRRLEADINAKQVEISKRQSAGQMAWGGVSVTQFFGLDVLPFAVELAKVTLAIAPKLASDELHTSEPTLPLANLDGNIQRRDALLDELGNPAPWPAADVIIGNPPFLGAKRLKPEHGPDYVDRLRLAYPEVPGMADYCVYWFRRAHDHLPVATADNPHRGRAGLVGTQNVRNNQSRVGGLDHIVKTGVIVEAVENQPWSGEANVHVSVANWVKFADPEALTMSTRQSNPLPSFLPDIVPFPGRSAMQIRVQEARKLLAGVPLPGGPAAMVQRRAEARAFLAAYEAAQATAPSATLPREAERALAIPAKRKLWSKVEPPTTRAKRAKGVRADKTYELVSRQADSISSTLSDEPDTMAAGFLCCNVEPQRVFNGHYPRHVGFRLSPSEAQQMLAADRRNADVVHPFLVGAVMLTAGSPDEWIIDFQRRDIHEAQRFALPFAKVQRDVLPHLQKLAAAEREKTGKQTGQDQGWLQTWWRHFRARQEMHDAIGNKQRYIACCEVTKRPTFAFVHSDIRPDKTLEVFAFDDDYSFGVLQSSAHWIWFITKCSKMKSDFRYTPESVFDTFPWPQSPSKKQVKDVAAAAVRLRKVRADALQHIDGGLRALYRTLELPGKSPLKDAHADLDAAVLAAYGFSAKHDLLRQLLALNQQVAAAEKSGETVTAPGLPAIIDDAAPYVTEDCVRP